MHVKHTIASDLHHNLLVFIKKWDHRKSPDNQKVRITEVCVIKVLENVVTVNIITMLTKKNLD